MDRTKGKWTYYEYSNVEENCPKCGVDLEPPDGFHIVNKEDDDADDGREIEIIADLFTEANAEFICKAVNAHSQLVEACKDALKKLEWPIYTEHEALTMKSCRVRLKAALEAAGE